jgi:hypothetical protein
MEQTVPVKVRGFVAVFVWIMGFALDLNIPKLCFIAVVVVELEYLMVVNVRILQILLLTNLNRNLLVKVYNNYYNILTEIKK